MSLTTQQQLLGDVWPMAPPEKKVLPPVRFSSTESCSSGGGWIVALSFVAITGLGYVLVQTFDPAANELLGWMVYGFGAAGIALILVLALVLVALGIADAFSTTRRVLGRGLVRLRSWLAN